MIAIFMAGTVALLVSGFGTPILLRSLADRRIGQQIRKEGPAIHIVKEGTPTMGGIAIIVAAAAGYLVGHVDNSAPFTSAGGFAMAALVAAGAIGLADDWLKVRRQRSLGLNKRAKVVLQLLVGIGFALAIERWAHADTVISFTRASVPGVVLGTGLWVVWATFIVTAGANAVNLTDGLDGLAAGSSAFTFAGLTLIGYWQYRHVQIYHVHAALDLALVAIAMAGACVGFLWWNAAPARIFMGDTGSLALGGLLAYVALAWKVEFFLLAVGAVFFIEELTVAMQIASFQLTKKRIFSITPIHHHFQVHLKWPEQKIVTRAWILGLLVAFLVLTVAAHH